MASLADIEKRLKDLFNQKVAQPAKQVVKNTIKNAGNAETSLEKNVPLYGQLQSGIRESVAPVMRNFTSQQNVDKYKSLSQPNKSGFAGTAAKFVGSQVPYVPLMMATEGAVNPVTSKIASLVPKGKTLATAAASGAAKGAIKFAPFGWMGGLEHADTAQERVKNIGKSTLENAALGGVLHGTGSVIGHQFNAVKDKLASSLMQNHGMNQQEAEKAVYAWAKDEMGRFTGKKVAVDNFDIKNIPLNLRFGKS
jgi:hypothetical protein